MKYFSMFTGIGGFELGINQAFQREATIQSERQVDVLRPTRYSSDSNLGLRNGRGSRPLCIGYSEIDKYAIETYEHNFGKEVKNYGDATTINTAELPDFDLLVGGFPCQAFSVAGKRAGFEDTRGTLIFDVVRILRDKRPRHFVLENVKGLLSHDSGKTFAHILEILTDAGYDVSWSVHNSKNYGVPQNRERIFIIGNLRGERRPQVFPITQDDRATNEGSVKGIQQANTLRARDYASWRGNHIRSNKPSVRSGGGKPNNNNSLRRASLTDDSRIRRLTPVECERLQGFPDNWTQGSDTQRYKQCGNAVTTNVVEHVIGELYGN